jgi:hypothetical protein
VLIFVFKKIAVFFPVMLVRPFVFRVFFKGKQHLNYLTLRYASLLMRQILTTKNPAFIIFVSETASLFTADLTTLCVKPFHRSVLISQTQHNFQSLDFWACPLFRNQYKYKTQRLETDMFLSPGEGSGTSTLLGTEERVKFNLLD